MKNTIFRKDFKTILEFLYKCDNGLSNDSKKSKKTIKTGYLIKKKILDELKDKLKYNYLKKYITSEQFGKFFCEIKFNKITTEYINAEIFNTKREFIENLCENNSYILVNYQIPKLLYNDYNGDKSQINYEINSQYLILYLNTKEKIYFKNDSNLININSLCSMDITVENIYESIIEYYKFEKLIIKQLKEDNGQNINKGYLIDENCFNEWKIYSNYDYIKNNFLSLEDLDDLNDKNADKIKEFINNEIVKFKIRTLSFKDSNSLITSLKNKNLLLISESFFLSLLNSNFKQTNNAINYSLKNMQITLHFKKEKFNIASYNNIISLNIKIYFKMINNLINFYMFHKKIKKMLEKNNNEKFTINNIKLIDKKFIQNIKEKYNYNNLIEIFKDLEINENNENNENNDNYKLLSKIPESYFDDINNKFYLNDDYKNNKLINSNSYYLEIKKLINKNISYLDNFELINDKIFNNIICSNKEKIPKYISCFIEKGNLLIKYQIENNITTYCFGYFNKENSFELKYLISLFNELENYEKILSNKGINSILNRIKNNEYGYYDINNTIGYLYDFQINKQNIYNKRKDSDVNINNFEKKELSPLIKEEILTIIKIYLFNYDLKKNILSIKNILRNKCYIINKDWISTYKKYYLYDELSNYLNYNNYIEKLNLQKDEKGNIYNEKNTSFIYNDIKEKSNFFNIYHQKDNKLIDKNLLELKKQRIENKDIYFNNDFIIINKELYNKLINNKYKNIAQKERVYIINNGKLIIKFEDSPIYQILIGNLNTINDECNIIPYLLLNFKSELNLIENFNILSSSFFNDYLNVLKYNNYKIISDIKEVGEAFLLKVKKNVNESKVNNNNLELKIIHNCSLNYNQEYKIKENRQSENHILLENLELNNNSQKKEIEKLKEELTKCKSIVEQKNGKIKILEQELNLAKIKIENDKRNILLLNEAIATKDNELKNLKIKVENMEKSGNNRVISYDEMICVNFISTDQKINNFGVPCAKTDVFAEIEERLYKSYKEYRETNNIFMFKGKIILRFKTIEENHIENGVPVILDVQE